MSGPPCHLERRSGRVPDDEGNVHACYCPRCPTFDQCMIKGRERLYCSRGRTECALVRLGCVCGECPVALRYGLSSNYYCDEGKARF